MTSLSVMKPEPRSSAYLVTLLSIASITACAGAAGWWVAWRLQAVI